MINLAKFRLSPVYLSVAVLASGAAADTTVLEEVVVTAQKREQSLQDVPIALNAFNAEFLRTTGAQNLDDLQQFTPGLQATNLGVTQPTFSIRGIGTNGLSIGTDPAVGIYMDGVYVGRSASSNTEFSDIERVEVLKGPQGTLFGRNAAAGAIQIITQKPSQDWEGFARVRAGNYNKLLGEVTVNTPLITDTLAARFNLIGNQRDGYIENAAGGDDLANEEYYAGRASFLWTPGDVTDLRYSFDYNRLDQDGPTAIGINPRLSPTGTPGSTTAGDVDVFGVVSNDVLVNEEKRKLWAHTLQLDHDFDWSRMTWIASYRTFEANVREDEDGVGFLNMVPAGLVNEGGQPVTAPDYSVYLDTNNIEDNNQFYTELRFAGEAGSVNWVGGLSYYDEDGEQAAEVAIMGGALVRNGFQSFVPGQWIFPDNATCQGLSGALISMPANCDTYWVETMNNEANTKSMAAFGDATWQISDAWSLTAGLRYTRDEKKFGWYNPPNSFTHDGSDDQIFPEDDSPDAAAAKTGWVRTDDSWTNIDPRVVLNYFPTEDVMLWASFANGYTAGGFNSLQVGSTFEPENVNNFEVGVKSELFDQTLRLNASVYRYYYLDKQDIEQVEVPGGTVKLYKTITGDAEGTGFDLEATWLPVNGLQLGFNYGYLDAVWTDRVVGGIDLDGESLDSSPKHRAVFLADYNWTLGDAGALLFHFDYSWSSKLPKNIASPDYDIDYETKEDALQLANARVAWQSPASAWQVAIWAENLFDTEYVVQYNGIAEDLNAPYVRRNTPRFYGAEIIYSW